MSDKLLVELWKKEMSRQYDEQSKFNEIWRKQLDSYGTYPIKKKSYYRRIKLITLEIKTRMIAAYKILRHGEIEEDY